MTDPRIVEAKSALRRQMRARRDALAPEGAGAAAAARFFAEPALTGLLATHPPVAAYWPIGSEFDSKPLLAALLAAGFTVGLPSVVGAGQPLIFRRYRPDMALVPAGHGTLAPPATAETILPRIVIAPLLAADARGFRLGYGGGYYDRTLAALRATGPCLAIGLGYAAQLIDTVPVEPGDARLDYLLTEAELVACREPRP